MAGAIGGGGGGGKNPLSKITEAISGVVGKVTQMISGGGGGSSLNSMGNGMMG